MKLSFRLWQIFGFVITSIAGTILHFLYEWTGGLKWIAPFSGVNESTWEHMKLLFWPMFIFAIVQSLFFKERYGFWHIKLRGIFLGLILIPIIFYTYNGVIGRSPDWFNIAIFFIAAAIAYIYETQLYNSEESSFFSSKASFALLCAIALLFIIFTFVTPRFGIFKDPLTGTYGITQYLL